MKLRDYTEDELEVYRKRCNFTADEMQYFNLRAKDHSNVSISLLMNISTSQVSKLAKRVNSKILKIV